MMYNQSQAAAVTATAQVLLPMIRRVMPNIIASQLISVQPMTGPVGQIFNSTWTLDHLKMKKVHYQHFLRVYNRKTYHKIDDIVKLGYTQVTVSVMNAIPAKRWCTANLKPGSFVMINTRFVFAYDRDATLFALRWS